MLFVDLDVYIIVRYSCMVGGFFSILQVPESGDVDLFSARFQQGERVL